jgi:hypothetical protein
MKTSFLVVSLALLPVAGFTQGKVIFGNDSNHLIILDWQIPPAWSTWAGLAVPQIGTGASHDMGNLTADLLAGTNAANLALAISIPADGLAGLPDGRLNNHNTILPNGLSGTVTFQIRIWETAAGSYENATTQPFCWMAGHSAIFTAVTGSLLYNPLTLPGAPSNSTWGEWTHSFVPRRCS